MCRLFQPIIMGVSSCVQMNLQGEVILDIEVQPASSRQGVVGFNKWRNNLQVAVKAEAQKGRANFAVCNVLKTTLGADVEIVQGHTSKQKKVKVIGMNSRSLIEKLEGLLESRETL